MKTYSIIFFVFILITSNVLFGYNFPDTTIMVDLNGDNKTDNISINFELKNGYYSELYTLYVNDLIYIDTVYNASEFHAEIVDLDKSDEFKEIALFSWAESALYCQIIRYDGKSLIDLGEMSTTNEYGFSGNGSVVASHWIGFWSADVNYFIDEDLHKLKAVYKEEYTLDDDWFKSIEIITLEKITLLKSKDINSNLSIEIAPGTRIYILKADIRNSTVIDENIDTEYYADDYNWYYIKTDSGGSGWIMLKDFKYKVDGIPWAG